MGISGSLLVLAIGLAVLMWAADRFVAGASDLAARLQVSPIVIGAVVTGTDWSAIDYKSRGIAEPDPEKITTEFLRSCCGGSEQMAFQPAGLRDYMYGQGLFDPALAADNIAWQGMMPEYFPLAYDDFILDIATVHCAHTFGITQSTHSLVLKKISY